MDIELFEISNLLFGLSSVQNPGNLQNPKTLSIIQKLVFFGQPEPILALTSERLNWFEYPASKLKMSQVLSLLQGLVLLQELPRRCKG